MNNDIKDFFEAIDFINNELHVDQLIELGKTFPYSYIYDLTSKTYWLIPRNAISEILIKYKKECINLKKKLKRKQK